VVSPAKLTHYLLDPRPNRSPTAASKVRFFTQLGFPLGFAEPLSSALRQLARRGLVAGAEPHAHGVNFQVIGPLPCPGGREVIVFSVWVVKTGETVPSFVTARPAKPTEIAWWVKAGRESGAG
jgi:hypothetical protein